MKNSALITLMLFAIASCNEKQQTTSRKPSVEEYFDYGETGMKTAGVQMIPIETPKGTFKVWTKRIGNNPRIKILILHGGPALTHEYMECFQSFFPQQGFEMYEYDQLGSYYSDQPTDSSLWTLERFVEEVEQVRIALGLNKDNFYLLGNSWGGILGMEYALKYQQNMKGLIVSNMTADYTKYGAYNKKLRTQMRKSLVDSLESYEKAGKFTDPVYLKLVFDEYYCKHILRKPESEWPEPVLRSFKHINQPVYEIIQGPSEFVPGGRLLTWECWTRLKNLSVPTLMIGSRYDTMNPEEMEEMSKLVQHGTYLYCPNGGHLSMWDAQEEYYPGVIKFIKDVDEAK
ncbi:MAG: proline iminopeptidase-family hydrolase [Bacteroidota bacterium]